MTQQLNRLSAMDAPDGGMFLALPESEVGKLLPSLNAKAATIELSDVLNVIAQHMRGTEFYANGNPVLNRLALQSRARELITAMKQEATAAPQQHEAKTAPQPQGAKAAPPPQKVKAAAPRQHQAKAGPRLEEAKAAPRQHRAKAGPRQHQAKAAPPQRGAGK